MKKTQYLTPAIRVSFIEPSLPLTSSTEELVFDPNDQTDEALSRRERNWTDIFDDDQEN